MEDNWLRSFAFMYPDPDFKNWAEASIIYERYALRYGVAGSCSYIKTVDSYLIPHLVSVPRGFEIQVNLIETIWELRRKVFTKVVSK